MDKKNIKFDDTEIEKYKFLQYKSLILIDSIDINKIAVYNKVSFGKKDFKYFIDYTDAKKLDLYVCSFQKWVHIEEILIKLNEKLLEKYNEIWETVSNISKRNLTVNLYTIKNIKKLK